jgi:hypothetical protein
MRPPQFLLRGRLSRRIHAGGLCISGIWFPPVLAVTAMSSVVVRTRISVKPSVFFSRSVSSAAVFFHMVKLCLQRGSFVNKILYRFQVKIVESGQTMNLIGEGIEIDEQFGNWFENPSNHS